jgi:hypothetical protein
MVNKAGFVHFRDAVSGSWTKKWEDFADIAIGPTNHFWKHDRSDEKTYKFDGTNWVNKGGVVSKLAIGPKFVWTVDRSNKI